MKNTYVSIVLFLIGTLNLQAKTETLMLVGDVFDNDVSYPYPNGITAFGNKVVFIGVDGINGREPWISDGKGAGTFMLKDIEQGENRSMSNAPQSGDSYQNGYFKLLNGRMLFKAENMEYGGELWSTDGRTAGTYLVKDINPTSSFDGPSNLIFYDNRVYFRTAVHSVGQTWVTEETEAGTSLFLNGGYLCPVIHNDKLFFIHEQGLGYTNGTVTLKEIIILTPTQ